MTPPIQHVYDLSHLSAAGAEIVITAKGDELSRLAQWAEVERVTRFEARVTLTRLSKTHFTYEAELFANVVQACVATLEPVHSRVVRDFSRTLHLVTGPVRERETTVIVSPGDDDSPEEIQSSRYDLAEPLLEEFALAIDPYPRAKGVAFEPPVPEQAPESPFAVLKQLKKGG
jgi:uncharacterized metal-binding protein YceD (DUF177 family)